MNVSTILQSLRRASGFVPAGVVLFVLLGMVPGPGVARATQTASDTGWVRVVSDTGLHRSRLLVERAETARERYIGLSGRRSLAANRGMLFVYPEYDTRVFVMRNMAFPLDILYFDGEGRLRTIHSATVPDTKPLTRYRGSARWVLEVNYGWTARNNVKVGDQLQLDPKN